MNILVQYLYPGRQICDILSLIKGSFHLLQGLFFISMDHFGSFGYFFLVKTDAYLTYRSLCRYPLEQVKGYLSCTDLC